MKIIQTADLTPTSLKVQMEKDWVYNGLDCCLTLEILEALEPQLDNTSRPVYELSKSFQAPVLEMGLRGMKVNLAVRAEAIAAYEADILRLEKQLNRILYEVFDLSINWRSNAALKNLFYRIMKIPPIRKRNPKGEMIETVDRDALERLESYVWAKPIIAHLLTMRDLGKKISTLKTSVDPDGRSRTSYNIAGTTTYRFSSSKNEFGTGGNLQNVENRLRRPFEADPGMKLAYIDLEQAESRAVGAICWNLFHDGAYLDACESGDLHTSVCRMAWTNLPWTGDLRADRAVAEQPFYRQHSYRHMAKVLGHGSNYNGKPPTMAKNTKLEAALIKEFQTRYFRAFAAISRWHAWVASQLATEGHLYTLTGHRRWFFGRRDDDTTLREAIAYGPQGTVGVLLNQGMLRVWRLGICQLLLQIHDAIVVQFPEHLEDRIVPQLVQALRVPVELNHGRTLVIPSEAKTGWNWADATEDNPDGLAKFKGHDDRHRSPTRTLLDRRF